MNRAQKKQVQRDPREKPAGLRHNAIRKQGQ
jgi:hypothetical protein